ncbi:growth/differentiation factor 10b [Chanos chanos]|uniref:Interferon gamma receptor 1 n=1 Tax=Chanos chanos TaxID=29144 RepID=A0A6J2V9S9_CHACN|nr:interferon gamma receptor 1 [Chanos chanos]XP_030628544.1 interferon gamma receptor 1 [Chanos chanos]
MAWVVAMLLYVFFFDQGGGEIPAPTDVNIECHNFRNILFWNYSNPSLHPTFTVEIRSYSSAAIEYINTTSYQLDVTEKTKSIEDSFELTLKTIIGSEEYESSPITFSYNRDFKSKHECILDFPPLNISLTSGELYISFPHPLYIYNEFLDDKNDEDLEFFYKITEQSTSTFTVIFESNCSVENDVCSEQIVLEEFKAEDCFEFLIEGVISNVLTSTKETACNKRSIPPPTLNVPSVIAVTLTVIAIMLLGVLGFLLWCKKWIKRIPLPKVIASLMTTQNQPSMPQEPKKMSEDYPGYQPISSKDESSTSIAEVTEVKPIPKEPQDGSGFSESGGTVEDSDQSEDYGPSNGKSSDYDCPHVPCELSPGDVVKGYQ